MCIRVNKIHYAINCNMDDNNEAMVDVYSDMPPLIPIESPNFEEINKMIKLHRSTEKLEFNNEFLWFILMMSICFGGVTGIMRFIYLIKK